MQDNLIVEKMDALKERLNADRVQVYDFHNGEIYYAKVRLKGDTLTLHGSIDKSGMIGVDKVWTRLSDEEVRPYLHLKPSMQDVLKTLKDWQQ